jgi:hypothetical protein
MRFVGEPRRERAKALLEQMRGEMQISPTDLSVQAIACELSFL